MRKGYPPRKLRDALSYFSDPDCCRAVATALRWPVGVRCPRCGSTNLFFLSTRHVWKCKREHPGRQFSVKVGTVFEDSPIALDKWLGAIWMIANRPEAVNTQDVARVLGVTPKTAWYMLHRIQLAMNTDTFAKLAYPKVTRRASVIRLPQRGISQRRAAAQR